MSDLDYFKLKAIITRKLPDKRLTLYKLKEGIAIYNEYTNRYLWFSLN